MKKEGKVIGRRRFLKQLSLASLAGVGIGKGLEAVFAGKSEVDRVALALSQAKKQGHKGLVIIGDYHNGNGTNYVQFMDELNSQVPIDKIFMEGVYDGTQPGNDPYIQAMADSFRADAQELTPQEIAAHRREDPQGYFRLKKSFEVEGIEDPDLYMNALTLSSLEPAFYQWTSTRDPKELKKVIEMHESLKTKDFDLNLRSDLSFEETQKIGETLKRKQWESVVRDRNVHCSSVINQALEQNQTGALIIGSAHYDPEVQKRPEGQAPDILQSQFDSDIKYSVTDIGRIQKG